MQCFEFILPNSGGRQQQLYARRAAMMPMMRTIRSSDRARASTWASTACDSAAT